MEVIRLTAEASEERLQRFVQFSHEEADEATCETDDAAQLEHNKVFNSWLNDEAFVKQIATSLDENPRIPPEDLKRRYLKSFVAEAQNEPSNSGYEWLSTESWDNNMHKFATDSIYRWRIKNNLYLPVASCVSQRLVGLDMTLKLHDFPGQVSVVDLGCSLNHVLKRMALRAKCSQLALGPVEVVLPTDGDGDMMPDPRQARFNRVLRAGQLMLGPSVGVDVLHADTDPLFMRWARSNSFYIGELMDPQKVRLFDTLAEARPPQVSFQAEDISSYDPAALGRSFDAAYLSMIFWQIPDVTERMDILERAEAVADRFVVIHDAIYFDSAGQLQLLPKKNDFNDAIWVKDMRSPADGYQKYFGLETPRMKRLTIEPAALDTPRAAEYGLVSYS